METAPTFGRLTIAGAVGGLIGGILSFLLWLLAGAIGMPTDVEVTGQGLTELAWFQFLALGFLSGTGGGIVAGFLRKSATGFKTFSIIAVIVLVLSMAGPLIQPDTVAWSTRIILMATHVLVFIVVVKAVQKEMTSS
jgi:hypothetical protein